MKRKDEWQLLYKLGGIAPLITISLYLCEFILISWDNYPTTIEQWYALFNVNQLLGLFYLNSLDMISIGILGIMYLALFIRLKEENKSLITISLPFAFTGISVFIVPRTILLSLVSLTRQFTEATNDIIRNQIITSGDTISTLGIPTFQTAGFFIICLSSLLVSITILRSRLMPKIIGYLGVLGFFLTLLDDILVVLAPKLSTLFMIFGGCVWIIWWVLISINLLKVKVDGVIVSDK